MSVNVRYGCARDIVCCMWQLAVYHSSIKRTYTAVCNINWHILFLLHVILIQIKKIVTKTAELYNLAVSVITPDGGYNNERDVVGNSLSQSPSIGMLVGLN